MRQMRLYNTQLGKWLQLVRIQSTPLTAISLSIGYFTVTSSFDSIITLIFVGALGHWGFYAVNDIYDRDIDSTQNKVNKPLVSGDISMRAAKIVSVCLIGASLVGAILWFPSFATASYLIACVLGWHYNKYSKEHTYSSFYLGGWGMAIIFTGGFYARGANIITLLLALLLGVHMVWMTVIGDLKDIENDEPNLPHKYDCHISKFTFPDREYMGQPRLFKSLRFQAKVALPLLMIQFILGLAVAGYGLNTIFDFGSLILVFVIGTFFFGTGWTVGANKPHSTEAITRDIVVNEILAVMMILAAMLAHISPVNIAILFAGSVMWGLSWQKIQYGSALYFP